MFFIAFSLTTALWLFLGFILFQSYDVLNLRTSYAIGSFIAPTALIWIIYFVNKKLSFSQVLAILGSGLLFFIIAYIPNGLVRSMTLVGNGLYSIEVGSWYYLYMLYAAISVGVILWLLVSTFYRSSGIFREQLRYILFGAIIFGGEIVVSNTFFPYVGLKPIVYLDTASALFFTFIAAYSIARYRFMNVRLAIRKGTVYATTLAIIIGLYSYLVFVISQTTSNVFKIGGDVTSVAIIILIALGFHPLKKMVEHTLNEYIFPKRVDLRAAAKRITLQLSTSITEIEKIIKAIRDEAKPALGVESIDLFFQKEPGIWGAVMPVSNSKISVDPKDPLFQRLSQKPNIIIAEELEYLINDAANPEEIKSLEEVRKILLANGAAAVVPIVQHPDTIIGILFLGPKANQSAYTVEDIQFLKNLQQNLPLSLSGIILYYQAMKRVHMQIKK